ncbi:MAG TPA: hypothetical protein V6C81_26645 [Planktothrix sp.]
METDTAQDVLSVLLSGSNMLKRADLDEASSIAAELAVPFQRALIMSGFATEEQLQPALEAEKRVRSGKLSLDEAMKALRLAVQRNTTIDSALKELNEVHKKTGVYVSATNELTSLLIAAKIITPEQLGESIKKAAETGMMIGQVLLLEKIISLNILSASLNALFLIKDSNLEKDKASQGLKYANQRSITIEQSLFELQFFTQPSGLSLRLGELFEMGQVISRAQMVECLEVEFFKQKQFGQILLEQGLITHEHLDAAVLLQNSVGTETLKAYQAAEALKRVCLQNVQVYQAMAEAQAGAATADSELRLGPMLVQAGLSTEETIEKAIAEQPSGSNIKVGKLLLTAGLIKEKDLYNALRCQSLVKLGYMSGTQSVQALEHAYKNSVKLDEAMATLGLNVPSRMQWSWV